MRNLSLEARRYVDLALLTIILMAGCSAPKTATVTPSVVEEQTAGQPVATNTPGPTPTLQAAAAPDPTDALLPTPPPTHTPSPTVAPTATESVAPAVTPIPTEAPTETPASQPVQAMSAIRSAPQPVELVRVPDTDPAPPFTILVDAIRLHENNRYKVTGTVRNDGSETYERVGVRASFLDDKGNNYLPLDVFCPCLYLEPGAECPFSVGTYGRDLAEYRLHPNGQPVGEYHQPASLVLSGVNVSNLSIGYVSIAGTVTNANAFTVKDAAIIAELEDASGNIVSVGSAQVLGGMTPGASERFELYIEYEPYSRYQLRVQAVHE